MELKNLIKKLREVKDCSAEERKNVDLNIKICEMQIKIIDGINKKNKRNK